MIDIMLDVKDLEETLKAVTANGGKIVQPRSPVQGVGWMAVIKDTEGNTLGLMERDDDAA